MPTNYSFTGQRLDQRSGLLYDNARYYDPVSGRFTRADTLQTNTTGSDPYAYAGESPETKTDLTGNYTPCDDQGHRTCSGGGNNKGGGKNNGSSNPPLSQQPSPDTPIDNSGWNPVGSALSTFSLKYHSIQVIHIENQTELSDFLLLPALLLFHTHTEPTPHTLSVPYDNRLAINVISENYIVALIR